MSQDLSKFNNSRAEKDLAAIINNDESLLDKIPKSRMEELLIMLYNKCQEQDNKITELNGKLSRVIHIGNSNATNATTVDLSKIPIGVYFLFNTYHGYNGWILVNTEDYKNIICLDNNAQKSTIEDNILTIICGSYWSIIYGYKLL